jgi:hypothetical protein
MWIDYRPGRGRCGGGATGGILGGLLGLGIPRHEAEMHEEQVREGRTIVSVQADTPAEVETVLRDAGAEDVRAYVVEAQPVGTGSPDPR